jgi:ParB-like chromosome segregation protein Spo0J
MSAKSSNAKNGKQQQPPTTTMSLALLKPHPLQSEFYADCTPADDEALAADLRTRGQQAPIIIMPAGNAAGLPAGTILDGHRRATLMAANGETKALVVVRDDLKNASSNEVEAEFLNYNFMRRQQHPLDQAKVAKRLFEIEKKRERGHCRLYSDDLSEARDRVGARLNQSGRNLQRYLTARG